MIERIQPYLFVFGVIVAALAACVLLGLSSAAVSIVVVEALR